MSIAHQRYNTNNRGEQKMLKLKSKKWLGLGAAVMATAAFSLTAVATLGGFSASIVNPTNQAVSGTVQLKEGVAATACYSTGTGTGGSVGAANSSTCSVNLFGGLTKSLPGTKASTTVTLTNVGNTTGTSLVLTPGTCASSAASNDGGYVGSDTTFCTKMYVTVQNKATAAKCVYPASTTAACPTTPTSAGTLAGLGAAGALTLGALAVNAKDTLVITVMLSPSANNSDQGLAATMPMTWELL
jgi:hypothetical protein